MRVFVTGATGWIGTRIVKELVGAGHQVSGLCRSDGKAGDLAAAGAEVVRGTLDDLDLLRSSASAAEAVVHTAFNHDFTKFADNARQDQRAIEALGDALRGTDRPLLVTSGLALLAPGRVATEADVIPPDLPFPRRSEATAQALAGQGVHTAMIRLSPSVHGLGDRGFLRMLIDRARAAGVSAYLGDGENRWPGVHVSDAGRLYRLVLETGATEAAYHVADEEGVPFRAIAEVIGRRLGVPVERRERDHFDWFAEFVGMDMAASSARTREVLRWTPTGPDLLSDLDQPGYFANP